MANRLRAGIVGATGMVGQRFIMLLQDHPYFEITALAASASSAGKKYKDAVEGRWKMKEAIPAAVADMVVLNAADIDEVKKVADFVFCAVDLPKEETKKLEEAYAKAELPVVSNNSANRWTDDVPMVIPEINGAHFEVIEAQRKRLGTKKRLYRRETELLDSELCSRADAAPFLWHQGGFGHNLPGDFRRRQDLRDLPGNYRQHHSLHRRRRGKEREGAAEDLGQRSERKDCSGSFSDDYRAVRPRSGKRRAPCGRFGQL